MSNTPKFAFYLSLIFMLAHPTFSYAAVATAPSAAVEVEEANGVLRKKELRQQRKFIRKSMKSERSGVISNKKFQIGLLSFAIGFGFSLLGWLTAGAAFLGFIGVLGIVIGLLLMTWGFLEFLA